MSYPRKPVSQKIAEGTYRADRDKGIKIVTLDKMPAPSLNLKLSKDAEMLWYNYGTQLIINGLLTFLDLITFGRYCQLYDRSTKLKDDIEERGFIQMSDSGMEKARPTVNMLNLCESEMLKIEDRFGLSPNSRAKIPAEEKQEKDELLDFLN